MRTTTRFQALAAITAATALVLGAGSIALTQEPAAEDPPSIVVTTAVLGSVVDEVAGDQAEVIVLMPGTADPHAWRPSARDAEHVMEATLVVENGLNLEEGLIDVLEQARADGVDVFTAADYVEVRMSADSHDDHDEHDEGEHAEGKEHEEDHGHDDHAEGEAKHDDHEERRTPEEPVTMRRAHLLRRHTRRLRARAAPPSSHVHVVGAVPRCTSAAVDPAPSRRGLTAVPHAPRPRSVRGQGSCSTGAAIRPTSTSMRRDFVLS